MRRKSWFTGSLIFLALIVALCAQTMQSPLTGAWLLFFLAACLCIYPGNRDAGSVAWLSMLGISTFILQPVGGGAATMWILAAAPLLSISVTREHVRPLLTAAGVFLLLYAVLLIAEMAFNVRYTTFNIPLAGRQSVASSWPMLDPNNAGCVMNFGLVTSFYLMLRNKKWFFPFALFVVALYATSSRMAAICGFLACSAILAHRHRLQEATLICGGILILFGAAFFNPDYFDLESLSIRGAIWRACLPLLDLHPLRGTGLGTFGFYYAQVRTESITAGTFAHNDMLQLAIETGIGGAAIFLWFIVSAMRRHILAFALIGSVFLHSLVEFQFYIPVISVLVGLTMAASKTEEEDDLPGLA
jgi:O-antigen ligase